MRLIKNPEVKRTMLIYALLTAVFAAVGFAISGAECAVIIISSGATLTAVYYISCRRRYSAISELAFSIDRILHGQEKLLPSESEEGELAILRSEIQKMTVRLGEQAEMLIEDKHRLTDAVTDISHQLRTPLTSMNLTVSLLSSGELTDERRINLTRELKKSLRRIDWLVEALLKMSKLDAGSAGLKAEKVAVKDMIKASAEPFLVPMELKNQELRVSVGDESFTGDPAWSAEALGNVIKNCTEHTPNGGYIEICASETALFTEITVRDSGKGFSKEDIPHIFERFYKGENSSSGSVGIGLALARMIMLSQNGTIKASNAKDGGVMFTLRFYKSVV